MDWRPMKRQLRLQVRGMNRTDSDVHVSRALRAAGAPEASADRRRGEARPRVPAGVSEAELTEVIQDASHEPGRIEGVASPTPGPRPAPTRRRGASETYDLAIVGSGGAAFAAAITAREADARVVMIERGTLGGTCVNVGCVPSKTLLRGSEIHHLAGHDPFVGLATRAGDVDLAAFVGQKDDLVRRLRREKYADLITAYGWDYLPGEASFADAHALQVDGRVIRAAKVVVATGTHPHVPPIQGLADAGYLTSTTALELKRVPESLVVIGAGYVALELGQLFRRLGSQVTLVQRSPRLLKDQEPEVGEALAHALANEGIALVTGASYRRIEGGPDGRRVVLTVDGTERVVEGAEILVATGRDPSVDALELDRAGVRLGTAGEITIDRFGRTSNPDVYAAGDVTGGPQYVYVAAYEGKLAAENALHGDRRLLDLRVVPGVIFTTPAVATVGLTEARAQAEGYAVKTSVLPTAAVPRAIVNHDPRGVFKLVADARSERLLGAHVVADGAGDVIYAVVLAVQFKLKVKDLTETLAPYLTMAEGLRLAAQAFGRDVSKLSCCTA